MSGYKDFAIEVCDAVGSVTGDEPEAMLEWLDGYEGCMAEGVCTLLEGDSEVQECVVDPMYETCADGSLVLGRKFRARLQRLLDVMTGGNVRMYASVVEATPESVLDAVIGAYAYAEWRVQSGQTTNGRAPWPAGA